MFYSFRPGTLCDRRLRSARGAVLWRDGFLGVHRVAIGDVGWDKNTKVGSTSSCPEWVGRDIAQGVVGGVAWM